MQTVATIFLQIVVPDNFFASSCSTQVARAKVVLVVRMVQVVLVVQMVQVVPMVIPDICHIWYTTALSVKSMQKSA